MLTRFPGTRCAGAQRPLQEGGIKDSLLTRTPMLNLRYVVVSAESRWQIVRGGRRFPETYASKTLAICTAIAYAERDGLAGRRAEVMVRHENGLFITEWIFGEDVNAAEAARPPLIAGPLSTR